MDNGGPAFACASDRGHQEGLSLRDYFAAAALQGLCASSVNGPTEYFSTTAFELADAMLKERARAAHGEERKE